ncbi:cysteine desulfurase family protein [Spirosoma montaniterrae]|uniref:cysteine desulfurase n=1 Tax=Spirosoma montaniterrae TaxID=1178516 RepID=A0A1P9WTV2_9BACT|nr:cysteine desulfurase family protein [Spirosoma montaniterrae]AQG78815.1 cysteine desulfurase IscS [Spirosoma montaniterrae]
MNYPAYFDYNATTPVDPRVLETMLPYFNTHFGNAASRTHVYGLKAEAAVDEARGQLARLLGADRKEIVFTSGATESINLAVKGVFEARQHGNHIVTVMTEHKAVLDTCVHLEKLGADVTYLQPDTDGLITPEQFRDALRPNTLLASVMWANNETGVIQPIAELATIAHERGVLFHTDATQAVGKLSINLHELPVDLLSLSGHKLYAPKGIGALVVRHKTSLIAQQDGGRHERGRRSGTLNVPGIVALGKAAELALVETQPFASHSRQPLPSGKETQPFLQELYGQPNHPVPETQHLASLQGLRDRLETGILKAVPDAFVNGSRVHRLPTTTNIAFAGVDGEMLLGSLNQIAVSNGSACTAASTDPSHVLKAMGLSDDLAYASVRFSLGRFTTEAEVDLAIQHVSEVVGQLRHALAN